MTPKHFGIFLSLGLLAGLQVEAGAIRPTAQMGPRARRILASIRTQRTQRETAREKVVLSHRIAIARIRTPGDDPDLAIRVAQEFEEALRARGFSVRPYRKVWPRIQKVGVDLLGSPLTLRQLCRRLRVGKLIQLTVHKLHLGSGNDADFATPSWWGPKERAQEFAEAHLRMQVFDAEEGKVVMDRQDRQLDHVPALSDTPPARGAVLGAVLGRTTEHLLFDLRAPGKL
jgi:hypothetical protein